MEDAELVSEWMTNKKQEAFLTRTFKRDVVDKNGRTNYEIRIASIQTDPEHGKFLTVKLSSTKCNSFNLTRYHLTRG